MLRKQPSMESQDYRKLIRMWLTLNFNAVVLLTSTYFITISYVKRDVNGGVMYHTCCYNFIPL